MKIRTMNIAAIVAAVSFVLMAATADAHARYDTSTPAKSEVVTAAPGAVTINYTQDVQKISGTYDITVVDVAGASVTSGSSILSDEDRSQVSVPLRPGLAAGRYEVRWENISDEDGDPAEGAFSFYIGTQPTAADIVADEALAQVGAEDDATPAVVPSATTNPVATAPASVPSGTGTMTVPSLPGTGDDGGGSGSRTWIIVAAIAVSVAVGGFVGWQTLTKRG